MRTAPGLAAVWGKEGKCLFGGLKLKTRSAVGQSESVALGGLHIRASQSTRGILRPGVAGTSAVAQADAAPTGAALEATGSGP